MINYDTLPEEDREWISREARRMGQEYELVPWHTQEWFSAKYGDSTNPVFYHMPHLSEKHPGLIAYTENFDKGRRDIQTPIKPGKYLQRFFGDVLSPDEIREWASKCSVQNSAYELHFTTDADEIERVYTNGPHSCMSHKNWDSGIHPCRVYSEGDLALAYLTKGDDIVARTIVWPENKTYVRIYGDFDRLKALLEDQGYCQGYSDGARIKAIPYREAYIMPYIDGADLASLTDDGAFFVIDNRGMYCTDNTNGTTDNGKYCEHCESHTNDDTFTVNNHGTLETWCEDCYSDNSAVCEHCDENVHVAEIRTVRRRSTRGTTIEEYWCDSCCDNDATECEDTEELWHSDCIATTADGRHISVDAYDDDYFTCDHCAEIFPNDEYKEHDHGSVCTACHSELADDEGSEDDDAQQELALA